MKLLTCTSIGLNRNKARFWIEGQKLDFAFRKGQKLKYDINHETKQMVIQVSDEGTHSVSVRSRTQKPLVEIKDDEFELVFGIGTDLRVAISKGLMVVSIQPNVIKQQERENRIKDRVRNGKPLRKGSVFTGGGVIDAAFKEGFESQNLDAYTKFCIEVESKYVDSICKNQPDLFRSDSYIINSGVEMLDYDNCPTVDIILAGIPCTGSSNSWRSGSGYKKGSTVAESHNTSGAAFFYLLNIVKACNPSVIVFECVLNYRDTSSMLVIKNVLDTLGYDLEEGHLNGLLYGSLEDRDRYFVVAKSKGLNSFDMSKVVPLHKKTKNFNSIVDHTIPLDSPMFRKFDYLKSKRKRDIEKGNGFKIQLLTLEDESCGTIRRAYWKAGSTDQYLEHPFVKTLSRLFTVGEHARIKRIPEYIVNGCNSSVGHEILGQSGNYTVFNSLANWVAISIIEDAFTEYSFEFSEEKQSENSIEFERGYITKNVQKNLNKAA